MNTPSNQEIAERIVEEAFKTRNVSVRETCTKLIAQALDKKDEECSSKA